MTALPYVHVVKVTVLQLAEPDRWAVHIKYDGIDRLVDFIGPARAKFELCYTEAIMARMGIKAMGYPVASVIDTEEAVKTP